jgi:uncharacterized membrane protein YeaQ/YmgE (transglycosylase-associated protein family)
MTGKGFGVVGDIITGMAWCVDRSDSFFRKRVNFVRWWSDPAEKSLIVASIGAIIFLYGLRMVKRA